jgi:hypothetical protein
MDVIVSKIILLDFVHCLDYKTIELRFGSWILLLSSGTNKGEEDRKSICWAP